MVKETAKGWELVPPTPPYEGQPDISREMNFALGRAYGECWRKIRYVNHWQAAMHARSLNKKTGGDAEVYQCRGQCGGYHVGSASKHRRKFGKHGEEEGT